MRTVTIQDVARLAGVSTATVSRAVATPDRVTAATREAVFSAIRATGYTPNAAARSLRAKSARMVLVVLPGIGNDFFTPVLKALEEVFSRQGYGVLIGYSRQRQGEASPYGRILRAGQVDGVLFITGAAPVDKAFFDVPHGVPITMMFSGLPGEERFSVFDADNRTAAAMAVGHLIGRGHRRIAHIAGPQHSLESVERLRGYREALMAAGLAIDETLIWHGAEDYDFLAGARAATAYFALHRRPTAVFAAADEIAVGFLRSLKNGGVSAPADISIVGFDDTKLAAHYDPALTTMHQPREEMGRLAAEDLILRMLAKDAPPPARRRLPCTLVIRESVLTLG